MSILAGIDIGGTKCAVCVGRADQDRVEVLGKIKFQTPSTPHQSLKKLQSELKNLLAQDWGGPVEAIGISCGGPLDSRRGLILSPPNLPGWDRVDVVTPFVEQFSVPTGLQNDANACALAEGKWGAGRGCENFIFLTFGTGMGAGLILNGRLYSGANDMAGEAGHIRLAEDGPEGYGKRGSFEGFCSGGGIASLAREFSAEMIRAGHPPLFCQSTAEQETITAEKVGEALAKGDPTARRVFETSARYLGRGLAILVDLLNPQKIIIGSIYGRQRAVLEPLALEILRQEALPQSLSFCEIVPAGLGEAVGDLASLSVAWNLIDPQAC